MSLLLSALVLALLPQAAESEGTARTRPLRLPEDAEFRAQFERYRIPQKDFTWSLKEISKTEKVSVHRLAFPSPIPGTIEENRTVRATFWQPAGEGKDRPAAVFLHWLGGRFDVLELVCRRTAEKGIPSLMVYLPHYGPRRAKDREDRREFLSLETKETAANIRQAVVDVRRAGDWLASRPDVDPERVGIVGISLGAVMGSLVAGVDDRFSRCVFIIGGGDLPGIVFHGAKETIDLKKALEEKGYTVDRLRTEWKGYDPVTFASRLRAENVLMINAEDDEVIPKAATLKLRDAIGSPRVKWFKGGHYGVIFRVGPILKDIESHLASPAGEARE